MLKMMAGLFVVTAINPTFATAANASIDKLIIECRSKNVADAGYDVRVLRGNGNFYSMVFEETFAGLGTKYFDGEAHLNITHATMNRSCKFLLTNYPTAEQDKMKILISQCGQSRIMSLPNKSENGSANQFFDLVCTFDQQTLVELGCERSCQSF